MLVAKVGCGGSGLTTPFRYGYAEGIAERPLMADGWIQVLIIAARHRPTKIKIEHHLINGRFRAGGGMNGCNGE